MTQLDRHVDRVRNRLVVRRLVGAASWVGLGLAFAGVLAVVVDRLFAVALPAGWWPWVVGGAVVTGAKLAAVVALIGRPTRGAAAVEIDRSLGLKERFSTAVFVRDGISADPFARAAVSDAEAVAGRVDVAGRFGVTVPRRAYVATGLALLAVGVAVFVPRVDLFGRRAVAEARGREEAARVEARASVARALAVVGASPVWREADELGRLVDELRELARLAEIPDPAAANRKELRAMELAGASAAERAGPRDGAGANGAADAGRAGEGREATATEGRQREAGREAARADGSAGHAKDGAAEQGAAREGAGAGGGRPVVAGDRLAGKDGGAGGAAAAGNAAGANGARDGNQPAADAGGAAGRDGAAAGNAAAAGAGQAGDGGGVANDARGAGVAAGDRGKATAPFAVKPERSPGQDVEGGRILARDLVPSAAKAGESRAKLDEAAATAARQAGVDEVDPEHVSGAAQGAARRYFETTRKK